MAKQRQLTIYRITQIAENSLVELIKTQEKAKKTQNDAIKASQMIDSVLSGFLPFDVSEEEREHLSDLRDRLNPESSRLKFSEVVAETQSIETKTEQMLNDLHQFYGDNGFYIADVIERYKGQIRRGNVYQMMVRLVNDGKVDRLRRGLYKIHSEN